MNESAKRLSIVWSEAAKADLRAIDRQTALDILHCVARYLETRTGDVKKLKPPRTDYRLRCGEYRIFFDLEGERGISVNRVKNRREAYR